MDVIGAKKSFFFLTLIMIEKVIFLGHSFQKKDTKNPPLSRKKAIKKEVEKRKEQSKEKRKGKMKKERRKEQKERREMV